MLNLKRLALLTILISSLPFAANAETGEVVNVAGVVQKNLKLSEAQANEQVEKIFSAIKEELQKGRVVEIKNFGKFYLQQRVIKRKTNPKDPTAVVEEVRKYPRFTSSPTLKNEINKKS